MESAVAAEWDIFALQMLILHAVGLQLAFPSAADRWFRPNGRSDHETVSEHSTLNTQH